jgi:glycosyltransferase involved in cell wall biosynthesis
MEAMQNKKILIISEAFPPEHTVSSLRIGYLVKYLSEVRGYDCHVFAMSGGFGQTSAKIDMDFAARERVTVYDFPIDHEKERAHRKVVRRSPSLLLKEAWRPEVHHPHCVYKGMIERGREIIECEGIDLILATTCEVFTASIAWQLSNESGIPYAIDLRDLVEQWPSEMAGFTKRFRDKLKVRRRNKIIQGAASVVVVSDAHQDIISRYNPTTVSIYNGYDAEMFRPSNQERFNKFSITYTGMVYDFERRDARPMLDALKELIDDGLIDVVDVSVDFYGSEAALFANYLKDGTLRGVLQIHDPVNYSEVPGILAKSCILVVLTSRVSKGILTTKFFEYVGVGRPVLCVPNDRDALAGFFEKNPSIGWVADDKEEAKKILLEQYTQWKQANGELPAAGGVYFEAYSRQAQSARWADLLDGVIG